jgi:integrase
MKHANSKVAAEEEMRRHIDRVLHPERHPKPRKEVPTFKDWFDGRFWREWVVGRKNKPSERASKRRIYENYLLPFFGEMHVDEIGVAQVAQFRAHLVEVKQERTEESAGTPLSDKYINNILAVLSKTLKYAEDVQLIGRAPKVGLRPTERPEIECWDFDQYARLLAAAKQEGPMWFAAVCLAGEAGLRVGEVKGLRWREDVDLVAGTITVNQQIQEDGHEEPTPGTPKGRTRRVVPIGSTLDAALRGIGRVRTGYVVCKLDGSPLTVGLVNSTMHRICRLAGLPERGWHVLRHGFGTHAAMFGVNPWSLMNWMGHKRIDETMRYVHFASAHRRPMPEAIVDVGMRQRDPEKRIIEMLSARARGKGVAKSSAENQKAG